MNTATAQHFRDFVLNKSSIIFLECNENGIIEQANHYALELMGPDITGKSIEEIFIDFSKMLSLKEICEKNSEAEQINDRHLINVNTQSGFPETYYFCFKKNGDNILVFGEKNHEEDQQLKNSIITLNNELSNLTRELHKTNAELKKVNEQKNRFLGIAAHDLRNPLGTIEACVRLIKRYGEDAFNEKQLHFLDAINITSKFMLGMVNDLLDVSAIESGHLVLRKEYVQFQKMLDDVVEFSRLVAEKKKISINARVNSDIPLIKIDKNKISQVINNLISNAIKYSHENTEVIINVSFNDDQITVSVKDNGLGIPRDELANLFRPFGKTSVQSTAGEKSTGLGLMIVKKIIDAHNGSIDVQSEVDRGSVFTFTLPVESVQGD